MINHESQQLLFLGDHWIGDGERFAIIEDGDYNRLKMLFAETREHRGEPTPNHFLDRYNKRIHTIWTDDPDDFYREYYFPDPKPITTTVSPPAKITTTHSAPSKRTAETSSENRAEPNIQLDEREHEKHADVKQKAEVTEAGEKSFSDNRLTNFPTAQDIQHNSVTVGTADNTYLNLWLWIFLLAAVLFTGFWWRRKNK